MLLDAEHFVAASDGSDAEVVVVVVAAAAAAAADVVGLPQIYH